MKKLTIVLFLFASTALATPAKQDADAWLLEIRQAKDNSQDALFINNLNNRIKLLSTINKLDAQAEKLFDESWDGSHACQSTPKMIAGYLQGLNTLLTAPARNTNINSTWILKMSWEGAQWYAECRDKIDLLK